MSHNCVPTDGDGTQNNAHYVGQLSIIIQHHQG
jgi:hypothetical protein